MVNNSSADSYTDYDRMFKQLIGAFLLEFMELYFTDAALLIEQDSIKEENCELRIMGDLSTRIADLVYRLRMRGEKREVILHIEGQEQRVKDYNRQMFSYFIRLHEKYPIMKILSVVVFSSGVKVEETDEYSMEFPFLKTLRFRFLKVQLKKQDWKSYRDCVNPIAAAMLSRMKYSSPERIEVKLAHLRIIARLSLPAEKVELIMAYFDSGMTLTEEEELIIDQRLQDEFGRKESEKIMGFVTSYQLKGQKEGYARGVTDGKREGIMEGRKEGMLKGVKEGIVEGKRNIAMRMIEAGMPVGTIVKFTDLSAGEISRLAKRLGYSLEG